MRILAICSEGSSTRISRGGIGHRWALLLSRFRLKLSGRADLSGDPGTPSPCV